MGHRVFGGLSYWQWVQLSVQLRHMQLPAGDSESICCFPFAPGAGDLPLLLPSLLGHVQDPGMEEMLRIRLELQVGNRPQGTYWVPGPGVSQYTLECLGVFGKTTRSAWRQGMQHL